MITTRNWILICLTLVIPTLGLSQDFRKGYLILTAGDTIHGFVKYKTGDKAYMTCEFRETKDQSITQYDPGRILGYGFIYDKFFESKEIQVRGKASPELVFLEVLVKGTVSLYKYEETYWVVKEGTGLQQLLNDDREVEINGSKVLKKTNQHVATLGMLLTDCVDITARLNRGISLDERPLTNLIEAYNKCKGDDMEASRNKKPWMKLTVGMVGGVNNSHLKIMSDSKNPAYKHLTGSYEPSTTPMIGFSADFFSPRVSERIVWSANLLYIYSKFYNYKLIEEPPFTKRNYVTMEIHQLKVPIGFNYLFHGQGLSPYVTAGVSFTLHVKSNYDRLIEIETDNVVSAATFHGFEADNGQVGFWGGVGVMRSISSKLNASLEVRYEQTDGVCPLSFDSYDLRSRITNFQVLLAIKTK